MAERLVDRPEKGAALALPLLCAEPIGNTVEVFVLPAIVARQALDVRAIDHGALITVVAGLVPAIHVSSCREGRKTWMPGTRPGMTKLRSKRRFGLADDGLECRGFTDRKIRQHLAIDRDPGFGKAGDEAAVVKAKRADGGIEPLDPQGAEAAL